MKQNYDMNILNILGTAAPASPETAPLPPEEENDQKRRKAAVKFLVVIAFILIIIAFWTSAWFSSNKQNSASGMGMRVGTNDFEIAAYGTNGVRNESIIQSMAAEYLPGANYPYGSGSNTVIYSKTGDGTDCLRLQYSTGESEIGPGGSGVCDLYVIPKRDGEITVEISMNLVAYAYADVYDLVNEQKVQSTSTSKDEHGETVTVELEDDEGNPIYDTTRTLLCVSDINTTDCNISEEELEKLQEAARLLQGHIMFFEKEGVLPAANDEDYDDNYYYEKPIINRTFTYTEEDAEEGKPFYVPIRWMWPNTLGQLALQTNENELRSGIPIVQQAVATATNDKGKILTYLKANQGLVFKGIDSSKLSERQQAEYAALTTDEDKSDYLNTAVNDWIDAADNPDNFETLSNGYNSADLAIGSNIAYFLIEITVTSGTAE